MADGASASTSDSESYNAFSGHLKASIGNVESSLAELLEKQRRLLARLESINESVGRDEAIQRVHATMLNTQKHYKKLLQLKKDILEVYSKVSKLKGRAEKVYIKQETELRARERQMFQQEELDRRLAAQPARDKV